MELMSSMLLCALVALLPQTLGKSEFNNNVEIRRAHKAYKNSPRAMILNMKGAYTNENSVLHTVYEDVECQKCHDCMDRSIKAQFTYNQAKKFHPSAKELHEDLLRHKVVDNRFKRDVAKKDAKKDNKLSTKHKEIKPSKQATVTKYDVNGSIYALKIKDIDESGLIKDDTICEIYSVKKSVACDSPEVDTLLIGARKERKKMQVNKTTASHRPPNSKLPLLKAAATWSSTKTTAKTTPPTTPETIFKKREMDNSDAPDFMPSIEEMAY
ncbi:uncharacterized protein LOC128676113 [Plodia interpunctella]|uniref:uncharacterized protein LOC128676113 n=1 Tax=Plodia interpunctella TaxID=58824 RepID=UPI002368C1D8|nr:uncharacterized protein LOC128676113 [Plodia interpunctella]